MGKTRRLPQLIMNFLLVVSLVAIWIAFAPAKWGGQVSYVLVNGISMEPGFHSGDLVIVRQAPAYEVGDIITYRDAEMEAHVIHRIIGTEQDRFIAQGDNNSWIDAYQPTHAEIVGKLWLHLPKFGAAVEWVRLPANMALTAGLLGGFLMMNSILPQPNKNSKKKNNKAAGNPAGIFETALYGFGILALVFLALSVFAFTRPVMRNADNIQYRQTGDFFYSATSTPGVYDTESVHSGDPVFTRLTCTLNLGFIYFLVGEQPENISGSQQLYAMILDDQSGWKRTLPLISDTNFSGNTYTSLAALDLCQVQEMVSAVEKQTGLRINTYTLIVAARVLVTGKLSGQQIVDTFEPRLTFKFDSLHFYMTANSSQTNPMQTVQNRSISNSGMVENTFQVLGVNPRVGGIRTVAIVGVIISLGGLLALGLFFYLASKRDPQTIIRIQYGSTLIEVYDPGLETFSPMIEVISMEDLANLAGRQNAMIMHLTRDSVHYYFVQVEGTTYRYTTGKSQTITPDQDQV